MSCDATFAHLPVKPHSPASAGIKVAAPVSRVPVARRGMGLWKGVNAMRCSRCSAEMQATVPLLWHTTSDGCAIDVTSGPAWRCYACGDYVDATILRNRAQRVSLRPRLLVEVGV